MSEDESDSFHEDKIDVLPINTTRNLEENLSNSEAASLSTGGAAVTTSVAGKKELAAIDSSSTKLDNSKEVLSPSFERHSFSPLSAARSPGAAQWTPEPPSTDSSPQLEPWSPKEAHFSLPPSPVVLAQDKSHTQTPAKGLLPDPLMTTEDLVTSSSSLMGSAGVGASSLAVVGAAAAVTKFISDESQPVADSEKLLETKQIDSHSSVVQDPDTTSSDSSIGIATLSVSQPLVESDAISFVDQNSEVYVASFIPQSPIEAARSPGAAIWTPAPSSTDSSPVLEPWSPKEVQFTFPESSSNAHVEPLVFAPTSKDVASDSEEADADLSFSKKTNLLSVNDKNDNKDEHFIDSNKAVLGAAALGTASILGATAVSAFSSSESAEAISDKYSELKLQSLDKSESSELVEPEQTTLAKQDNDQEKSSVESHHESDISSEPHHIKTISPGSPEDEQNFEILGSNIQSPKALHRSPGAEIWTPAPSSTDSSPTLEPWSPKEVQFSFPSSYVFNEQASNCQKSCDLSENDSSTSIIEQISLGEPFKESVKDDDSFAELNKNDDVLQSVADKGISFSTSTLEDESLSLEEKTSDAPVTFLNSEVDASQSNSYSSADVFAGAGIIGGVVSGVSYAIKSHVNDVDTKDDVLPVTEPLSKSVAIDRSLEVNTAVFSQVAPPDSVTSDHSKEPMLNEQLDEQKIDNSNYSTPLNDFTSPSDEMSTVDNPMISDKAVKDLEQIENEDVTYEEKHSSIDATIFKDSIHRSPGASIWTPEPSSTESSPDIVPWSPKEVHFSMPNSPVAIAPFNSGTVPQDIEPLNLGNKNFENMEQTDSEIDMDDKDLASLKAINNNNDASLKDIHDNDFENSGVNHGSIVLPIAATAAVVSSFKSKNEPVSPNLAKSMTAHNSALSPTVESASVEDALTSETVKSELFSDSHFANSAENTPVIDAPTSRGLELTSNQTHDPLNFKSASDITDSCSQTAMTPKSLLRSPGAAIWTPEPPSTDSSPAIEPWSPKEVQFSVPESPAVNRNGFSELSTAVLPSLGSTSVQDTTFNSFEPESKQNVEKNISATFESDIFDAETNSVSFSSDNKITPVSPKSFLEPSLPVGEHYSESEGENEFELSTTTRDNVFTDSNSESFSGFNTNLSAIPTRNFPIPARELYKDVGVFLPSESEHSDNFASRSHLSISKFSPTEEEIEDQVEDQEEQQNSSRNFTTDFYTTAPTAIDASTLGSSAVFDSSPIVNKMNGLNTKFGSESTSTLTVSDSLDDESSNASFVSTIEKSPAMFARAPIAQQLHSPARSISEESFVSVSEDNENDNRLSMASSVNILESFVAESTQVINDYPDYAPLSPIESDSSFRSLDSSPGEGNVTASLLDPVPRTVIDSHMGVQKSEIETQTVNISASIPNLNSIPPENDPLDSDSDDEKEGNDGSNNLPMESLFARSKSVASETYDLRSSTPIETSGTFHNLNGSLADSADNLLVSESSLKSLFTFNEPASVTLPSDLESYDDLDNSQEIHSSSDVSDEESFIGQDSIQHEASNKNISDLSHMTPIPISQDQPHNEMNLKTKFADISQVSTQHEIFENSNDHVSQVTSTPVNHILSDDKFEESLSVSNNDSTVDTDTSIQSFKSEDEFSHISQEKPVPALQDCTEDKTKESQFDFRENSTVTVPAPVSEAYDSSIEVESPAVLTKSKVWNEEILDNAAYPNGIPTSCEIGSFDFAETTVRSEISFPATSEANSKSPETPRSQVSFSSPAKTPAALTEDVLTEDIESQSNLENEEAMVQTKTVPNSRTLEDDWFALSKPESSVVSAFTEEPFSHSPDETFTFPSTQKSLPAVSVSVPEVNSHNSFSDSLNEKPFGLDKNARTLESVSPLSESIVIVEAQETLQPSLDPPALLPDPTTKSRRTPSVTLTPIVKETEPPIKDAEDIIFAVCVVGFHHAQYVFFFFLHYNCC